MNESGCDRPWLQTGQWLQIVASTFFSRPLSADILDILSAGDHRSAME
jgi:hypothetical protein